MDQIQRLELEKKTLMDKLKKQNILNALDSENKLNSILNDYTIQIIDAALEIAHSPKKKQTEPIIIPNEVNLRKFELDSKNGYILGWIILGKTYSDISELVYLSESTIRGRVSDMLQKFRLKNRKELAKFAIKNELVEIINE
jgi:DNA-binding NarL/FixJ family response regulator